jgi:hypothetical protein
MKPLIACAAALAAAAIAAPASAQNGAAWVDSKGRLLTFLSSDGLGEAPVERDRAPAEMAGLFKSLCLDSGGEPARIAPAAAAAGLTSKALEPGGFKLDGFDAGAINVWNGNGVALSRTGGFPIVPNAQCNTTFYVPTLPVMPDVIAALTATLGAPPSNLADSMDKKGRPKKYFNPEWTVEGPSGPRIIFAAISAHDRATPGNRVLISMRSATKAGR